MQVVMKDPCKLSSPMSHDGCFSSATPVRTSSLGSQGFTMAATSGGSSLEQGQLSCSRDCLLAGRL